MSQWGDVRRYKGDKFAPLIRTGPWEDLHDEDLIEDVFLVDSTSEYDDALTHLHDLRNEHVGKRYSSWLNRL